MAPKRAAPSELSDSERPPPAPKGSGSHAKPSESFYLLPYNPYRSPRIRALISAVCPLTTTLPGTLTNSKLQQLALQNVPQALGDGIPFGLTIRALRPLFASLEKDQVEVTDKWQMPFNDLATRVLTAALALSDTRLSRLYRIRLKEGNKGQVSGLEGYSCWKDTDLVDVNTVRGKDGVFSIPKDLTKIASSITIPVPASIEALFALFGSEAFMEKTLQANGRPKHTASTELQSVVQPAFFRFWVAFSKRYTDSKLATPVVDTLKQQKKWLKDAAKLQIELGAYDDVEENRVDIEEKTRLLHALLNLLTPSFAFTQPHSATHPQLDDIRSTVVEFSLVTTYHAVLRKDTDPSIQAAIRASEGEEADGLLTYNDLGVNGLVAFPTAEAEAKSIGVDFWSGCSSEDMLKWVGMEGGWDGLFKTDKELSTRENEVTFNPKEHQYVGTLETMARAWSGALGVGGEDYRRGVIVADEPGIGKTLQAILTILGFASLARQFAQPSDEPYPAIMLPTRNGTAAASSIPTLVDEADWDNHRGFADTGNLIPPALPSILIAPPDVAVNFTAETRRCSDLRVWRIGTEASASTVVGHIQKDTKAWQHALDNDLPLGDLNNPAHNLIIITPLILAKLSAAHGQPMARKRNSLFDLKFLVAVLDEAHNLRTAGKIQSAANRLTSLAAFSIAQTATPIVNTALDTCHMANSASLTHARHYLNSVSTPGKVYKRLKQAMAKHKTGAILNSEGLSQSWYQDASHNQPTDSAAALGTGGFAETLQKVLGVDEGKLEDYTQASADALAIHSRYLIRRCRSHLDSSGEPIVRVGTMTNEILQVTLTDQEIQHHRQYIEGRQEARRRAGVKGSAYGVAYTDANVANIAPGYYARKYDESIPIYCGTKIKAVLDLIELIREREKDLPDAEKSKFLIWCDSLEILPELRRHAAARNIPLRTFTGDTTADQRKTLIREVNKDGLHPGDFRAYPTDVVFCTRVAGESINLSRCNVQIHLSFPWSKSIFGQRLGRSWRPRQDPSLPPLNVTSYCILALNSSDIIFFLATLLKAGLDDELYGDQGNGAMAWMKAFMNGEAGESTDEPEDGITIDPDQANIFEHDALENLWPHIKPHELSIPTGTAKELIEPTESRKAFKIRDDAAYWAGVTDQEKPRDEAIVTEDTLRRHTKKSVKTWVHETYVQSEVVRHRQDHDIARATYDWIQQIDPVYKNLGDYSAFTTAQQRIIDQVLDEMWQVNRLDRELRKTDGSSRKVQKLPRNQPDLWDWWKQNKRAQPVKKARDGQSTRLALGLNPRKKLSSRAIIDLTGDTDEE